MASLVTGARVSGPDVHRDDDASRIKFPGIVTIPLDVSCTAAGSIHSDRVEVERDWRAIN